MESLQTIGWPSIVDIQNFSLWEAVRELVLLVTPDFPSSFVIFSGRLLNNSKSLSEIIGETDWTKCGPIRLIVVNSHFFSFWTNLSITYGLTNHCPYSTLKHYFISTQFISRRFGICRSCDPQKLQSGFEWRNLMQSIATKMVIFHIWF